MTFFLNLDLFVLVMLQTFIAKLDIYQPSMTTASNMLGISYPPGSTNNSWLENGDP